MVRYLSRRYRRRKSKSRKWVYIILLILIAAGVKVFIKGSQPSQTYAENENKFSPGSIERTPADIYQQVYLPQSTINQIEVPFPDIQYEPAGKTNSQAAKLIAEATGYLKTKPPNIIQARDMLNKILLFPISSQQKFFIRKQLSVLADKWLFSRTIYPTDKLCDSFKVKPGDRLSRISKKKNIPYEILLQINNLKNAKALRAGDWIKVINGPFHARVYCSNYTMDLYLQDTFVKSFKVGLGRQGHETPTGLWRVKKGGKLISPTWTDPDTGKTYEAQDPDYPLGSRWIGLEGLEGNAKDRTGFAIHGTKNRSSVGVASSKGCIRLLDKNAILMYDLLMSGVSLIEVVE